MAAHLVPANKRRQIARPDDEIGREGQIEPQENHRDDDGGKRFSVLRLQPEQFPHGDHQRDSELDRHGIKAETRRMKARIEGNHRSEEHTSELQSLMRISYAVFCLIKKHTNNYTL